VADGLGRALYQPTNLLRLITGAGMGVALSAVVAPLLALALAPGDVNRPVVAPAIDTAALLAAAGMVVAVVATGSRLPFIVWTWTLGLATLSAVALLNAVLVRQAMVHWPPGAVWAGGVLLAIAEMLVMAGLRQLVGV